MNKEKFDYEYTKNVFIQNIDDSYTLNLAMSFLEDKQSLVNDNLMLSKNNTNLKQTLNKIRDKLLCYGETFDSNIHKQFQNDCLEIINEVDNK